MARLIERGILCAAAALAAALVATDARACDLPPPEAATVAAVLDGETLKLADGRTVRLIGAKAPMSPLGWRGDDPWPLVDEAKDALSALAAAGKTVELRFGGSSPGPARSSSGSGLRGRRREPPLAPGGAGRQGPRPRLLVPRQPGLRRRAAWRARKRRGRSGSACGLLCLSHRDAALDVERLGRLIHSYQLVEGTVVAVGEGGGRLYLNFTKDWRSDFTVSVDRKNARAFAAAGIDLKAPRRKRLRVRGLLAWRNGPMIEATHPEQIELLPETRDEENAKPPNSNGRLSLYSRRGVIVAARAELGQRGVSNQRHGVLLPRLSARLDHGPSTSWRVVGVLVVVLCLLAFLLRRSRRRHDQQNRTTAEQIAVADCRRDDGQVAGGTATASRSRKATASRP